MTSNNINVKKNFNIVLQNFGNEIMPDLQDFLKMIYSEIVNKKRSMV